MYLYFKCFGMKEENISCFLYVKTIFSTALMKDVSIKSQLVRNGLFKSSKYTILSLTLKLRPKCNFLLLPSNQVCAKQLE